MISYYVDIETEDYIYKWTVLAESKKDLMETIRDYEEMIGDNLYSLKISCPCSGEIIGEWVYE